jgi:creatinine amidohydrolase
MQRKFILAAIIFAAWAPTFTSGAAWAAERSVFLEDQTWSELRDRIAAGTTTIIIPIGGTEQSGPDMALGKHNVRVKILAQRIAERLGDALVAPVIAYVPEGTITPPTGHMMFPGTITISDQAFEQMLESAAQSFKLHGFKTIVLVGDHGGYQSDESVVADHLNAQWKKTPFRVFAALGYYKITEQGYVQKLLAAGVKPSEIGTHAGLADTSLSLALDPALVRTDLLTAGKKFGASDGVYGGDPTNASAALGQLGVDLIVDGTTQAIRDFVAKQQQAR